MGIEARCGIATETPPYLVSKDLRWKTVSLDSHRAWVVQAGAAVPTLWAQNYYSEEEIEWIKIACLDN